MPRRKLTSKNVYIQIVISKSDRAAFDAWCAANHTTMSEVIRQKIASEVEAGKKLLEQ